MPQLDYQGVKGYVSYANAVKRGQEIEGILKLEDASVRWVVIALENGRFVPSFLYNNNSRYNPGWVVHQTNVCVMS